MKVTEPPRWSGGGDPLGELLERAGHHAPSSRAHLEGILTRSKAQHASAGLTPLLKQALPWLGGGTLVVAALVVSLRAPAPRPTLVAQLEPAAQAPAAEAPAGELGGDVVLVVNTASKCGFTPQFEALEGLQKKYSARGFAVLGFPSGDFREQEFTDEKEIKEFCTLTYGVKFPMFEKVHVVGDQATPLYRDLAKASGEAPKWNFHKYLLGRDGRLIASWGSKTTPDDKAIVEAIERALQAPKPKGA